MYQLQIEMQLQYRCLLLQDHKSTMQGRDLVLYLDFHRRNPTLNSTIRKSASQRHL